jgi:drug/metabolite transporter (DMT)-like permease
MPTFVIPLVATLGGALLLGEHVTPGMLAGIVLILAGIALVNQRS